MDENLSKLSRELHETGRSSGCLEVPQVNAIVVGNGAIGTALLKALLENSRVNRIAVLRRSSKGTVSDPRVSYFYVNAEQPDTLKVAAVAVRQEFERCHLFINTVGMLHDEGYKPEKRLCDVSAESLHKSFSVNAVFLPLLAQAFGLMLRHTEPAVLASLSARVGSIEDNKLGGWYSYRAAKSAQNMLLRTLSHEWSLSHRNVSVVALHPGTVESPLSSPFISKNYRNRVLSPKESAEALIEVIGSLRPGQSGEFYDWQGKSVAW